jgi:two-component system response regulator HydG
MSALGESVPTVLVVDDKRNMLGLLSKVLEPVARVLVAETSAAALQILQASPVDVVLSDLRLPDGDGIQILKACRKLRPNAEFVLMTAYASVATALEAMKLGAYDYVTKPFEPEAMRAVVERAMSRAATGSAMASPLSLESEVLPGLHAVSASMRDLGRMVRRIAASHSTTLILGETGTGKERIARAIHQLSSRAGERFLAVNCAAIPAELLESELFGYVKGSFTGADRDRLGLFEEARRGTLFLDEIGEMRFSVQAKLTRALEERAIRRVGEAAERPVDVRLVAATHRDLPAMTNEGTFRSDLWYRLNVTSVRVPPLRERREDIDLLAAYFLRENARQSPSARIVGFTQAAMLVLKSYSWPGNVRQLRSAIERACIVATGDRIDAGDLPPEILDSLSGASGPPQLTSLTWEEAKDVALRDVGRKYFQELLRKYGGRIPEAASHAGIERESFYRLLRKYGIESTPASPEPFRSQGPPPTDVSS